MKQKYAERIAEAEQQAQDVMRERDEEVKCAREEIEQVKAKAQADVADALARADASQEEAARIQGDLSEANAVLQQLKADFTHCQWQLNRRGGIGMSWSVKCNRTHCHSDRSWLEELQSLRQILLRATITSLQKNGCITH